MGIKELLRVTGIPVILASLCCLSPLILGLAGLSTASFAGSLADTLYGEYRWVFRGIGIIALLGAVALYLRRERGICTLDEAKRRRQEVINTLLITSIAGVLGYILFLYVIVHYAGVFFNIWSDYQKV